VGNYRRHDLWAGTGQPTQWIAVLGQQAGHFFLEFANPSV